MVHDDKINDDIAGGGGEVNDDEVDDYNLMLGTMRSVTYLLLSKSTVHSFPMNFSLEDN